MTASGSKIVLIGNLGMLGRDLFARLKQSDFCVEGFDLPEIDITKSNELRERLRDLAPALVINCAAYTAVDKAETEPEIAFLVNRDGPSNLAEVCRSLAVPLIHISTDYVFDGTKPAPYLEDDNPRPLGVYGVSKWEGEEAVRSRLAEHLIVRTAWLYGMHGHNFVKTILRLADEKESIRVVGDQQGCPTWTEDLADALTAMAAQALRSPAAVAWGTYHYCGGGQTTWHGFAEAIVEEARAHGKRLEVKEVAAIATVDYPTAASRPANSVLDCRKIGIHFGIKPRPWRYSLKSYLSKTLSA